MHNLRESIQEKEALDIIKHYYRHKKTYPIQYYDFFLHWSLINPLYNACSKNKKEVCKIIDFGKKYNEIWDNKIKSLTKEIISLECVGNGKNDAPPNKFVKTATLFLRENLQLKSDVCLFCSKKNSCRENGNFDFDKFDAILRILYQIRCNLFHGDKPELEGPQGIRNKKLVSIGNEILIAILQQLAKYCITD